MQAGQGVHTANSQRFEGIQYLRAIAALMVAYFHLAGQVAAFTPALDAAVVDLFSRGVNLFFVISGFVMMVTSSDLTPGRFMAKRVVRVVPLYWLLTGLVAALALAMPNLFRTTVLSPTYLVKSLLFIPYSNPGQQGDLEPLLAPGWTLNYEMFFYAVFAVLLFGKHRLLRAGIIFGALVLIGIEWAPRSAFRLYCNPIIIEFWLGMVIGQYYRAIRLHPTVSLLLIIGGATALLQPWGNVYAISGSAACIVLGVCKFEPYMPKVRMLSMLGDASYSIYLTHLFVFGVTRTIWKGGPIGFALFSMVAVIGVSFVSYRLIERPFLRIRWPVLAARRPEIAPATSTGLTQN
jgi:exopolysaccharide production protein ExoZ